MARVSIKMLTPPKTLSKLQKKKKGTEKEWTHKDKKHRGEDNTKTQDVSLQGEKS